MLRQTYELVGLSFCDWSPIGMQGEVLKSEWGHTFLHGESMLHREMISTEYSAIPQ